MYGNIGLYDSSGLAAQVGWLRLKDSSWLVLFAFIKFTWCVRTRIGELQIQ